MRLCLILAACVWVCFGCREGEVPPELPELRVVKLQPGKMNDIIAYGWVEGEFKPCGCSAGMLGGLDRFLFLAQSAGSVVLCGPLASRDRASATVELEGLRLLLAGVGPVALFPSSADRAVLRELSWPSSDNVVLAEPGTQTPVVFSHESKGAKVAWLHCSEGDTKEALANIPSLVGSVLPLRSANDRVVLSIGGDPSAVIHMSVVQANVDCIVVGVGSGGESSVAGRVRIVNVGKKGRYVVSFNLDASDPMDWVRLVPLDAKVPSSASSIALLEQMFGRRSAISAKHVRLINWESAESIKQCCVCHPTQVSAWRRSAHGGAWSSIPPARRGEGACVACHTTPDVYAGGSLLRVRGVGCNACHIAGADHLRGAGKAHTRQDCCRCHSQEKSPEFSIEGYWIRACGED